MRWVRRSSVLVLALILCLGLVTPTAFAATPELMPNNVGAKAYAYTADLSTVVQPDGTKVPRLRRAGTASEIAAADIVKGWFTGAGFQPYLQPFTYRDGARSSQNVVAVLPAAKKPKVSPTPLVIVGAHYDSSPAGAGADDNASGVGVMLEVAERIRKYNPEYDIMFVAFGAEEAGLIGSDYFVTQMSAADVSRCIAMVNFDSLIVGDKLYIHAGFNEKTGPRDEMLRLIRLRKLPIAIQPGLHPDYPAGLTPDGFSDYTAFNQAGIPIVAFESTNWEIGDLDGYVQTVQYGSFWHTPWDTLWTIEEMLPGRPMVRLEAYTTLVFEYLKHLNP